MLTLFFWAKEGVLEAASSFPDGSIYKWATVLNVTECQVVAIAADAWHLGVGVSVTYYD
jgi:hypothetical protein